jgi:hypothetical protein
VADRTKKAVCIRSCSNQKRALKPKPTASSGKLLSQWVLSSSLRGSKLLNNLHLYTGIVFVGEIFMRAILPIEVDLKQLIQLIKPSSKAKPAIRHWVKNDEKVLPDELPEEINQPWWSHFLGKTEEADAWQIE